MRFIGEKSWPPTGPAPLPGAKDDVLRITDEEPVFYIGPDTKPAKPARPRDFNQWLWTQSPVARAVKARRASLRKPLPETPRQVRPVAAPARLAAPRPAAPVAVVPPPPPAPLGPPPPLPSTRVRVGELAGSMLSAAPIAALASALTVPLTGMAPDAALTDPRTIALVFTLALLGSWGTMILGKIWEERTAREFFKRRVSMFVMGALVGLAGLGLAEATHLGVGPSSGRTTFSPSAFEFAAPPIRSTLASAADFATFFGLAYAVAPGWGLAMRNRKRRIRIIPIAWAGLVGGALGAIFPTLLPTGAIALGLTAAVTQFVSPWSRDAADYVRLASRRKVKVA